MMKKVHIVIPKEHGGWAMLSVPFITGMFAAKPTLLHIPLFLAWLLLYMASYPLLQSLKKAKNRGMWLSWGIGYAVAAALILIPLLRWNPWLAGFAPVLIVLVLVPVWHVRHKAERAFLNDICAILLFCTGGAAAYMLGGGIWGRELLDVMLYNVVYFTGTVFFVKSVFRERKNKRWTMYSHMYHIIALLLPLLTLNPWMFLPFLYPLAKTLIFSGKMVKPMKVGMMEIAGSVQFVVLTLLLLS